jgi:hypothetical protein
MPPTNGNGQIVKNNTYRIGHKVWGKKSVRLFGITTMTIGFYP